MIAGLLSMSESDGASGERAVRRSLRLVRAIASVQELLGEGVLSERAELGGCLEKTARSVLVSTGGDRCVDLLVDGGDFPISPESATAVCIIVSELVSNCVEHAFRDRESGHIRIGVGKDGDETVIEVADDGIGLAPDFRVDEIGMSSSGLGLASALASYGLGGRLEVVGAGNGTRAMLRF